MKSLRTLVLIFELCTLLDHADENKHLVTYWVVYHRSGFFVQKLGLYRITDGRPGKRIVSEYRFIILYISLYLKLEEKQE